MMDRQGSDRAAANRHTRAPIADAATSEALAQRILYLSVSMEKKMQPMIEHLAAV
jgi:hypothetical protein